ncbi:M1 family metallopeptidase [Nocardioides sp. Kera G14]|uniref:M1 family metallopeptidase n=1 Tax=Nocardioides sp. Kera G14 TaxID=2884264 RepID=UPI001D10503E|nr:M1 family metallopeptidase [Nocardioides sp. Kera G14]UDY23255.1 M1 family metallopeptidase [Nocardioides sp. Kera G14]
MRRLPLLTAAATLSAALLSGCGGHASTTPQHSPAVSGSAVAAYDDAVSTPQPDSVYPQHGHAEVDALHYELHLTWNGTTLSGEESLEFRASRASARISLDLGSALTPGAVMLDGTPVESSHTGDTLTLAHPVEADTRHTLSLSYTGTAQPVPDPSRRSDVQPLGLTRTPEGGLWTMQEPYGAFTWYAVNDTPSDKALYDVRITVPAGMVGISNGTLVEGPSGSTTTTTRWHSSAPMASYLTTLAVGRYTPTHATSASGVPLTYWVPTDDQQPLKDLEKTPDLLAWLEKRLGPYPFDSLSMVIVPAESSMETQTTLTLGDLPDDYSADTLLHEMAHQWYGDLVTPADWSDVWMNEGMATYLQLTWTDEAWDRSPGDSLSDFGLFEAEDRRKAGPPGDYKPDHFADDNVYAGPALMWDRVRRRVGDTEFWKLVRDWPAARSGTSVTRADYLSWLSTQSGVDLQPLMTRWLMSPTSPK